MGIHRTSAKDSRTYLRAYLRLQNCHKMLHKALRAMELDEEEETILLRIDKTASLLQEVLQQLKP